MYQLVSAVGKLRSAGARWKTVDIANVALATLYTQYQEVIATVTNNFFTGQRALYLSAIRGQQSANTQTLPELFASIGNTALPTTTSLPVIQTKTAIYSDAFRARYKVQVVSPNGHVDSGIPESERHWLALTKAGVDYDLFHRSCLVSVNGFFHLTDTNGDRVFVVDGMRSSRLSGRNQLGIYSFREVGALEFIPITESMVHRRYTDVPLKQTLYVDIGTTLAANKAGKTAMLVLGGYLHVLDSESFVRISDSIYGINFENLPLRDRYFESLGQIDLSSLGLTHAVGNPEQIAEAELYSDEVLTKYATLSQSFIVFVNNAELFVERVGLGRSPYPCTYVSHIEPKYPLVTGVGKISDYWRVKEDGRWALTVSDGIRNNLMLNTTPAEDLVSYDGSRQPERRIDYGRAHFLKVGTDIQMISGA